MPEAVKLTGEEGLFAGKPVAISSWTQNTADRRASKGLPKSRLLNGDVYPQEPKQDEDNMGSENLRKGYTTGPYTHEHESLNGIIDRSDVSFRISRLYSQVHQKKSEHSLASQKKPKDSITTLPAASPMKAKERVQWYQNLTKGKPFAPLLQNPPTFKKNEHMMDYFYDFMITPSRAIWNLKLAANIAHQSKKSKTFNGEMFAVEYAHALSRVIRQVFYAMKDLDSLDDSDETSDKWCYFTRLSRSAFDEGVIDRQEFINELCEIFTDIFLRRVPDEFDTIYQLEMWTQYIQYFMPSALQNLVLSRRVAVMVAQKLFMVKEEFEECEEDLLKNIREGTYRYAHERENEEDDDEDSQEDEDDEETGAEASDLTQSTAASRSMNEDSQDGTDPPPYVPISKEPADVVPGSPEKEAKSPQQVSSVQSPMEIDSGSVKEELVDDVVKEKEGNDEKEGDEQNEEEQPPKRRIEFDPEHPDKFVFDVMFACPPLRQSLNALVTLLYTCIAEQPGAMVHNDFLVGLDRMPHMITQLGASPLDYLPCDLLDLPFEIGNDDAQEAVLELVEAHEHDIIQRSELVQSQWSLILPAQRRHAMLIDGCLDVIGGLDFYDVFEEGDPEQICENVFLGIEEARYDNEVCARIRLCLKWAITVQRDGEWRGWLVAKVLKHLLDKCPHGEQYGYFGGTLFSTILFDFINNDLPKPGEEHYAKEFSNFCSLFFEFTRFEVFTHGQLYAEYSAFKRLYSRRMEEDPNEPLKLFYPLPSFEGETREDKRKDGDTSLASVDLSRMEGSDGSRMEMDEDSISVEIEQPEMGDHARQEDSAEELPKDVEKDKKEEKYVSFITLREEETDGFRLLDEEDIPPLEQLVIQLPIRQEDRHVMNNRTQMLYGNTQMKRVYTEAARNCSDEFIKVIRKKMFTKWIKKSDDVMFTRRCAPEQLKGLMQKMRQHTLFDRQSICNWVADGFLNTVKLFTDGEEAQLPTFEAFDLVCSLFEQTNNMHGFFEFALLVIPYLPEIDSMINQFKSVIMPGLVVAQYTYVICAYLVKHLHYFVHFEKAVRVVNLLYRVMERPLTAADYPQNGFGRTAAACIYLLGEQLGSSGVVDGEEMLGDTEEFESVFDQSSNTSIGQKNYNKNFMMDNLQNTTLRIYSYSEFKKRLPSFRDPVLQYSFVVNAFVAASKMGRDFDSLSELASYCSHWTAHQTGMAEDWMGAIRALCLPRSNQYGFHHLLDQVDVADCSLHYPLSTFAVLLSSKYCYSVPVMICTLNSSALSAALNKERARAKTTSYKDKNDHDAEPGTCIALLYLAQVTCASDDPFILSEHYRGRAPVRKLLERGGADLNILSMMHWCELDRMAFPMVTYVGLLQDALQARVRDNDLKLEVRDGLELSTKREYRKEFLPLIVRQVLISICEQEWVKDRMWKIADLDEMDAFRHEGLKQNCLGQQLLRLGTRSRCEREILAELAVCNGNSKKALIDKLLSVLNLWNFRATLLDLHLMIKEKSPESTSKNAQQGAIAAEALMGEIAKCCRELFVQAYRAGAVTIKKDERFAFSTINNFSLIPSLLNECATPSNMPSSFSATLKSKFMAEVCGLLEVGPEPKVEKLRQSAWLINDRFFINCILTCTKYSTKSTRDEQTAKDTFIESLLKQIQDLTKIKENPQYHWQTAHGDERIGLFNRLQLVGYVFYDVCKPNAAEAWAIMLFQLMLHGVITPRRNMLWYNTVFDMLSSIITWTLTDESAVMTTDKTSPEGEKKYRFPTYMGIVRKMRKELHDTPTTMETRQLHAFLPLPRNSQQLLAFEPFGTPASNAIKHLRPAQLARIGLRRGRPCLQVKRNAERIRITAFEMLQGYNPDNTTRKFPALNLYMNVRIDTSMLHPYRVLTRMMGHSHPLRAFVTNPLQLEDEVTDFFLHPISMEEVGEPPWVTRKKEKGQKEGETSNAGTEAVKKESVEEGVKREVVLVEATAAATVLGESDVRTIVVKKEIKQEVIILESPIKSSIPVASITPSKETMITVKAEPGGSGVTPEAAASIKATKRRSSSAKDGASAEKKERKKPVKRNSSGLTLQMPVQPAPMATPPKAAGILGAPIAQNQYSVKQEPGVAAAPHHGANMEWSRNPQQQPQDQYQPTTTLSQLMGQTPAQPPPQQQQQQYHLEQQRAMQQTAQQQAHHPGMPPHAMQQDRAATSQQIFSQHQQMQAMQVQQPHAAATDHEDAKNKLHDFLAQRQETKAAHPQERISPQKRPHSSVGGPPIGQQLQAAQLQQHPQPGPVPSTSTPVAQPGRPGGAGMTHEQMNQRLANRVKANMAQQQATTSFPAQYDASSHGASAIGGGGPYPNRPGAPAHNQSTNQPPQAHSGPPGTQMYAQAPPQEANPTPQQMDRLRAKQLAAQQQQFNQRQ